MKRRSSIRLRWAIFMALTAAFLLPAAAGAKSGAQEEPFRPEVHFSPARHWMNDPNGLVYFEGEYHLFFQYNPLGEKWGHMSWGHAVSTDLVHWKELPVAIPEDDRYMIFSGSIVVDAHDTAGFGRNGAPALVAIYTGARQPDGVRQNQQLAYSNDRGRTWTKYRGNPVLDIGVDAFRDPKVFWYEPSRVWIMVTVLADRHQVAFFSSPDLKQWRHLSDFGPAGAADGAWECPDLFALPIDGNSSNGRWVLKMDVFRSRIAAGSGGQYFTGHFDGRTFIADTDPAIPEAGALAHWIDYGTDFYAAASWANLPDPKRHVWIGWMNNHGYAQQIPTSLWRGAMSLPRELTLHDDGGKLRLQQQPVAELRSLRGRSQTVGARDLGSLAYRLRLPTRRQFPIELQVDFEAGSATEFGLKVHVGDAQETKIAYDPTARQLFLDRSNSGQVPSPNFSPRQSAPLDTENGHIRLHVFVDTASVEIFAAAGAVVFTDQIFPDAGSEGIELYADGGRARLVNLQWWELTPAAGVRQ